MQASSVIDANLIHQALWSRILPEPTDTVAREYFLAPIISELIATQRRFADAICVRIAALLAPSAHLREALHAALQRFLDADPALLVRAGFDLSAVLDRDPATAKELHVVLHSKRFLAIQAHRFAHQLWRSNRRELVLHIQACVSRALQVDAQPAAQLGTGIFFDHSTGIVIGETSVVEDNVSILQNVTLGATGKEISERHPKVRHGVLIGAGATILGNIEIGANACVGAGSVVLKPVAPGTTVAGVPARVVRQDGSIERSRTMDQVFDAGHR